MTYNATVVREGGAWLAGVPALEGAQTWAHDLRTLDQYVREVIVLAADLPDEAEVDLTVEFHTGEEVTEDTAS